MQTTFVILGTIIAFITLLYIMAKRKLNKMEVVADSEKIITLTDKNFSVQAKNKIILVDFWASWCAPCRMMAPVLNDVANELNSNAFVGKVDVEANQALASKYKVRSIPTMILFKNGVEVNRFVGVKNKEFLIKQIQSVK